MGEQEQEEKKECEEQQEEGESSSEDMELVTGSFCQLDGNISLASCGADIGTTASCEDYKQRPPVVKTL